MSTATTNSTTESTPSFGRLLRSEWTKIRSIRSTMWSLGLLVVLTIGFAVLFMQMGIANWESTDPAQRESIRQDPTGTILGSGILLSQLAVAVLGVLLMTSEYSSGLIRSSLMATPKRTPMLAAKAVVFGLLILVVGSLTALATFFLSAPIISSKAPVEIGDPGVLRAVLGCGLYLAVLAVFSLAIGGIVRHTAAAITTVIAFVLVIPPLAAFIPGRVGDQIHGYLPSEAGRLITQQTSVPGDVLGPWQGMGVFVLWTMTLLVVAAMLLERRDA